MRAQVLRLVFQDSRKFNYQLNSMGVHLDDHLGLFQWYSIIILRMVIHLNSQNSSKESDIVDLLRKETKLDNQCRVIILTKVKD